LTKGFCSLNKYEIDSLAQNWMMLMPSRHCSFPSSWRLAASSLSLVTSLALVTVLAGCGTTEQEVTERVLFGGQRLPPQQEAAKRELGCPSVDLLDGTAAMRQGARDQARGITFQAAIFDLARECSDNGTTQRIKVGVQGRLVLGDNGTPGTYTVRVAVRKGDQVVYSKLLPTRVTIPPEETQAPFVTIDEGIALPVTANDPADAYAIFVGLDPHGKAPPEKKRR